MAKIKVFEIRTEEQIEKIVQGCSGTHIRHNNIRKQLREASNELVNEQIDNCKKKVRRLKAAGCRQQDLWNLYSEITQWELKLL